MGEKEYLLLIASGNLKPLHDKFKSLGGFYNGLGYAFPSSKEPILKEIISYLPQAKIHKLPMGDQESFESFQYSHKASFFKERLISLESQIFLIQEKLELKEFSEEIISSAHLSNEQKQQLLSLLYEKENLKKAIDWAVGIENALKLTIDRKINIQFICEKPVNFLNEEAPEIPRLVNYLDEKGISKPFIRKGIVGMLVGAGGVGKTHALAQLAISITTGSNWFGVFPVEKQGHVFLGLGENAEEDIHRLLRKTIKSITSKKNETKKDSFEFLSPDPIQEASKRLAVMSFTGTDATFVHQGLPTPFYESFLKELKVKEPEQGWSCIILDPISRFLGADAETDNAAATRFISLLERISLELKGAPTVLFGHHMNKSGISSTNTDQAAARGSSAITDGVRWQANLERVIKRTDKDEIEYEFDQITMRSVKSNFTAILPPLKLRKDNYGVLYAFDSEKLITSAKELKSRK